jgi:predicted nucleotidyltransferase
MRRDEIIATLRAHEPELRAAGVKSLALFGSTARGEQRDDSDIDVVVQLTEEAARGGFAYFGRIDALSQRLQAILQSPVDVVTEPVHKDRLRRSIEKDRVVAF